MSYSAKAWRLNKISVKIHNAQKTDQTYRKGGHENQLFR